MSAYDAFISFSNFLKDNLAAQGIAVGIEKDRADTPPYLNMEVGPERIRNKWLSDVLCQGWLVVEKTAGEPLEVTWEREYSKVLALTRQASQIPKYDHSTDPPTPIGQLTAKKIFDVSPDFSEDGLRVKRVITWQLLSNVQAEQLGKR